MATVGELSKKFGPQLEQLQAIFPSWDEQDLVFALQDSKGNVEDTVLAISEGMSRHGPLFPTAIATSSSLHKADACSLASFVTRDASIVASSLLRQILGLSTTRLVFPFLVLDMPLRVPVPPSRPRPSTVADLFSF